ncbi:hypothetical protein MTQ01_06420 [Streptomyces sp. XM4193]|uniref:hypothetical protein n=1 Tax=Streptomyces sp. XM4193 TaxID=2929782 RepID=UPI001FF8DD60|nr:hypothetical protein [Streptomyces sp. XM4193]MCK1795647.1 hypothetical protein [Streptomyces sp. XM4193]
MSQRRATAIVTAVALLVEGVVLATLLWVLAVFLQRQEMSLDGIGPGTLALVTRGAGALLGLGLALCALLVLRAGLRDRPLGSAVRIALIACAVTHGVLAVLAVALVGWGTFLVPATVLGLLVWTLLEHSPPGPRAPASASGPTDPDSSGSVSSGPEASGPEVSGSGVPSRPAGPSPVA